MFYARALPVLVLFPVLFCRLRYTEQHRKYLLARYRLRKTGRHLLGIWAGILAVCCLEGALLLYGGLWQWGDRPQIRVIPLSIAQAVTGPDCLFIDTEKHAFVPGLDIAGQKRVFCRVL